MYTFFRDGEGTEECKLLQLNKVHHALVATGGSLPTQPRAVVVTVRETGDPIDTFGAVVGR